MIETKRSKLVGDFIKKRREAMGISQRMLGLSFNPPVTTQFISNVERGVTPLPLSHVPVLSKVLSISDGEIMQLLEKEYAAKISERLGKSEGEPRLEEASLSLRPEDYPFMKTLYEAYLGADAKTRQTFSTICESVLKIRKPE